jgi:dolichyl-phosphooligosaccharide-protein glycotransferase
MKHKVKKIITKIKENKKIINVSFMILLLLIPMVVSIGIRSQTAKMPIIDNYAAENVINFYEQQITTKIKNEYPFLPEQEQERNIRNELDNFLKENKNRVQNEIKEMSEMMKEGLKDDEGTPYLTDIDTWMSYYYATNYIEYGMVGERKDENGQVYEKYRGGRFERPANNRFHGWMMANFHKLWKIFDNNVPPMKSISYYVMIIATLSLIPAFFIGRKLSNNFGGFISAMIIAVHPVIMARTISNFADDDVYHLIFPLFAIWMVIEAYNAKDNIKRMTFASLAGLFVGLHSISWSGWWFGSLFIFASLFIFVVYKLLRTLIEDGTFEKSLKSSKNTLILFGTYFLSQIFFVVLLGSGFMGRPLIPTFKRAFQTFTGPLSFLTLYDVGISSIWPNVMTTVAELKRIPLTQSITQVGEPLLLFLTFIGLVMLMIKVKLNKIDKGIVWGLITYYGIITAMISKIENTYFFVILTALPIAFVAIYSLFYESNLKIKYSILFGIFLTGTIFSSTQGIRFMFLAIPIIALLIGIALGKIYDILTEYLSDSLNINKTLSRVVIIILMLWLVLPANFTQGYNVATRQIPMYNDAWDNTLKTINENSEDAIITSWWDFGHWFVAAGRQMVTFDGGDQGRRIHWVGKTLLTSNETQAVSILRMLNCGQEKPTEILEKHFDEYKSAKILIELVDVNDKQKAEDILRKEGLSNENVSEIMKYTYCDDLIDNYFIASSDMIGKSGVWGHFGSWDFDRAYMYNRIKNSNLATGMDILTKEYNLSETLAKATFNEIKSTAGEQWIAKWPSYMSNVGSCNQENNTIQCNNGVLINIEENEAYVMAQDGLMKVKAFSYIENDEFIFKEQEDYDMEIGVAHFPRGTYGSSIIMDEALTASMFTRMFFFEGFGLEHFDYMSYEKGIDGIEVYLYKVKFDEK